MSAGCGEQSGSPKLPRQQSIVMQIEDVFGLFITLHHVAGGWAKAAVVVQAYQLIDGLSCHGQLCKAEVAHGWKIRS